MADFEADVSAWVDKVTAKSARALQEIAQAAVQRVKELTPVDTGNLRANWVATINGAPVPFEAGKAAAVQPGDIIEIVNPVVYARRIEYGFVGADALGRHYNQPGHGMMAQTMIELPAIAAAVVKRLAAEQ